jgi:hypothetical protein
VADAGLHQDLVVAELGRLDRQAHAVLEAHEDGVEVGDVLLLGDLAGRAEAGIGPGGDARRGRGGDGLSS